MGKYVFIYHAPMTPAEATPPTPEQTEAVMGEWIAWAGRVGEGLVDFGTPLAGGVRVTTEGPRRAPARSPATASWKPPTWTRPSRLRRATRT